MNLRSDIFKSKITLIFLFILLIYNSIFNSFSGQFLFNKINPYLHSGVLKANVNKFSLFYGIELENLILSEKEENSPFINIIETINKLLLRQIDNNITKNQDKYKIIINNL